MTNEAFAPDGVPPPDVYLQDAIAYGQLLLMAYKMSGQGVDPPIPADFPKDYQIVKNVIMDDLDTPTFYGFIARQTTPGTNNSSSSSAAR